MLVNNKVTKSNELNLRAYRLSRIEQLFVLSVVSLIEPQDEDFKTYQVSIKDFLNLLGVEDQSKYIELPKLTKGLMSKVIEIKRPHSLLQVCWFSSVEHKIGEGIIEVEFSPKLKPYLLGLKERFVTYSLKQVAEFSSKYSLRIYELLKQFQKLHTITFSLNDLRLLIGLEETSYPRYSNLKQKILNKSINEINKKSDLNINFSEIKKGRKVISIKFYIHSNTNNELSATHEIKPIKGQVDMNDMKIYELINHVKILCNTDKIDLTDSDIHNLLEIAHNDINKIKKAFEVLNNYKKNKNNTINSVMGFLCDAIQENWNKGQSIMKRDKPVNKFINFKQRDDWDFDEIEKLERKYLERSLKENKQ